MWFVVKINALCSLACGVLWACVDLAVLFTPDGGRFAGSATAWGFSGTLTLQILVNGVLGVVALVRRKLANAGGFFLSMLTTGCIGLPLAILILGCIGLVGNLLVAR
jgi:hypothetical protein